MIINNNISAMNTHRQMGINQQANQNSMEKLSSGMRINRAGDDAAGLAISEKMRAQINGLDQASRNSQDGISMIQTAEGALNETHDILQRMRELAVQSSNDTNTNDDREEIQKEIDQLVTEIDRIADNTEFNTQNLLDGSFDGTFQIGANEGQSMDLSIGAMGSAALGLTSSATVQTGVDVSGGTGLIDGSYTVDDSDNVLDASGNVVGRVNGTAIEDPAGAQIGDFGDADALAEGSTIIVKDGEAELRQELGDNALQLAAGDYEVDGENLIKDGQIVGKVEGGAITELNGEELEVADQIAAADLGLDAIADEDVFSINGAEVSNRESASGTITAIENAIAQVSEQRSDLGAVQNRLEHTISNLDNASENLSAAESRIRDVDMAAEMMEMTRTNILSQASQSMLAQANQQPQSVLQLLG
ncbi:flagellin [Bacillus shivajii]|uniref:flagellin N-terminal helical domain-containing protein n=1 Tax=Bacillus shivajii TaxID=1983719 RepID=UPI001CF9ACB0|nr:flagellin [Bacillus shivajii]UCZ52689.1 flagellin [Bacillus shivajii]